MFNQYRFNNKGSASLIILFVALGVVATMHFSWISYLDSYKKNQKFSSFLNSRENLNSKLNNIVGSSFYVRNSLQTNTIYNNKMLQACLLGTPANSCMTNRAYPIVLLDLSSSGEYIAITGSDDSSPAYYNANGDLCKNKNTEKCPFAIKTFFTAVCANNALFCNTAEKIQVSYSIDVDSSYIDDNKFSKIAAKNSQGNLIDRINLLPGNIDDLEINTNISLIGSQLTTTTVTSITYDSNQVGQIDSILTQAIGTHDKNLSSLIAGSGFDPVTDAAIITQIGKKIVEYRFTNAEQISTLLGVWKKDPDLAQSIITRSWDGTTVANIKSVATAVDGISNKNIALGIAAATGNAYEKPITKDYVDKLLPTLQNNSFTNVAIVAGIVANRITDPTKIKEVYTSLMQINSNFTSSDSSVVIQYVDQYLSSGGTMAQAVQQVKISNEQNTIAWNNAVATGAVKPSSGMLTISGISQSMLIPSTMTTTTTIMQVLSSQIKNSPSNISVCTVDCAKYSVSLF